MPKPSPIDRTITLVVLAILVGGVFLVLLSFKVKGLAGRMDELKRQFQIRAGA